MVKRGIRQRRRDGSCVREIQEDLWDDENFEEMASKEEFDNRVFRRNSRRYRHGRSKEVK